MNFFKIFFKYVLTFANNNNIINCSATLVQFFGFFMAQLKYEQIKNYLKAEAVKPESAMRMPTIRELMRQFNVSLATVNRALSELEHTKVIIRRQGAGIIATKENCEVIRLEAKQESGKKCLALAYDDYPSENIWNTVHMIAQYTCQHNCNLLDCKIYPETPTEKILNQVQSRTDCVGLILLTGSDRMSRERLEALGRLAIPVVTIDSMFFYSDFLPDNIYVLSPDGTDCAKKMADVLVRNGHRRIGYIRNEPRSEYTDLHMKAFNVALNLAGVEFGPKQIFSSAIRSWENSLEAAVAQTRNNIETIRHLGLTALAYTSSNGALAAIRTLRESGLKVPEDISVIGEGERSLYRFLDPGLTVVTTDYQAMSCTAVEIALGIRTPGNHKIFFPHRLIERESVKDLTSK